jgi:cytochrome bd-type quinol oxidase subunit 2
MQRREIALCIFFTIITCGLYGIYWFICLTDDANRASGDFAPTGGTAFIFSLITCGIYGIYWAYKMGEKINRAKQLYGMPFEPSLGILYLVLSIFGLNIIAWALMQNELNKFA